MTATPQTQQNAPALRWINRIVRAVLRSPLHRLLSSNTLLLTITGRKTGKRYTIPVSYIQDGDMLTCYTVSPWWKNLRGGAPVTVVLRGQERSGHAEVIADDPQRVAEALTHVFRRVPRDARYSGGRLDRNGQPDPAAVRRAARSTVIVRIQLQ
jgi:deazaflavin-dependent oxidoreductase (nitroreductase family)